MTAQRIIAYVDRLRKEQGLGIADIADRVGTGQSSVCYWFKEKHVPNAIFLERLCDSVGLELYVRWKQ